MVSEEDLEAFGFYEKKEVEKSDESFIYHLEELLDLFNWSKDVKKTD